MKRAVAVALLVMGTALPMCAQHGGSHGGGGGGFHGGASGHSAPAFHGGFGGSAPSRSAVSSRPAISRYAGGNGFAANRSRPMQRPYMPGSRIPASGMRAAGNYGARPPYSRDGDARDGHDRNGHNGRRPYRPVYGVGFGYGVPVGIGPWIDSGFDTIGGDDSGYGDDANAAAYGAYPSDGAGDYDAPPVDDGPPPPGYYQAPYGSGYGPNGVDGSLHQPIASQDAPEDKETVTLVFRDGRPSEQVHNYMLSRTTLQVLDGHHRDIPVGELDLAATERVNRAQGVNFHLPEAGK